MDGIQGAVLKIKLKHLDRGNELRRNHASEYNRAFGELGAIVTPFEAPDRKHVYHVYALLVQDRDAVMKVLTERGIGCGIHYPIPVHLQDAYQGLGGGVGDFPIAERCASEFISLPMYPELTPTQRSRVIETVGEAISVSV